MELQRNFRFPEHVPGESELNGLIDDGELLIYCNLARNRYHYVFSEWPIDEQDEVLLAEGYTVDCPSDLMDFARIIHESIHPDSNDDPPESGYNYGMH